MAKDYIWMVVKERHTEEESWEVICGVYNSFGDALERVNEVFHEAEMEYIEQYGSDYEADNHNNGFAELHVNDGWDETRITATEYEINKPTYETL